MRVFRFASVIVLLLSLVPFALAQNQEPSEAAEQKPDQQVVEKKGKLPGPAEQTKPPAKEQAKEPEPVVAHHELRVGGKVLKYTATTGRLPINSAEGQTEAYMFFVAYTLDGAGPRRPLMFSFNGGPGSSSVWLHMGAIGPKRVKMLLNGFMPPPPYQLVDNEYTWLDQTDMVFIDPVGTGYSRAVNKEVGKKFYGLKGDIESVGTFIETYLSRYERWDSPLFLVGESYGTTRAAGLSGYLIEHGVAFNGIVLVSSVLNFETLEFTPGNELPCILYFPSYSSAAWFHKKLAPELEQDLQKTLREAEQFASGPYADALAKGDRMTPEQRQNVIEQISRLTGLSQQYVDEANLCFSEQQFTSELLRSRKQVIGRLDSRFTGAAINAVSSYAEYDPSMSAIRPPYTAMFNNYVRRELGYKSDLEYYILGGGFQHWEWGSAGEGFPNTATALREAFIKNPYMKLFVANGYFDLATPYFATQYTLAHMSLPPELQKNISLGYYDAGHMMYIKDESLGRLKTDVSRFVENALK
jgi:carboxypeptidase C (cathepsin A)